MPTGEAAPEGRRALDKEWRDRLENELKELLSRVETISAEVKVSTVITVANGTRLEGHITDTKKRFERLEPVMFAMDSMQAGIVTIGKIGDAAAATARWTWRVVKVGAPVAAAIAATYVAFHDQFIWIVERLRFWK